MGPADDPTLAASIDAFVAAIRSKDIAGVMDAFAPEVVSFDIGPPLQHGGGEEFRKRWQAVFDLFPGPIGYEVAELQVQSSQDLAWTRSLNRMHGTTRDGEVDRWLRWTACWRKAEGRWRIVHEHVSVPVDLRGGKALLALKP